MPPKQPSASDARLKELERLWSYAPRTATLGVVFTGDALAHLDHVVSLIDGASSYLADGEAVRAGGLRAVATLTARDGIDRPRGAAAFITPEAVILVFPVVDRDAFLAANGGRREGASDRLGLMYCNPIDDIYACSRGPTGLEQMTERSGELGRSAGVAGVRGDVELVARQGLAFFGWPDYLVSGNRTSAVAEIRRGQIVVRAHHAGQVGGPLRALIDVAAPPPPTEELSGYVTAPLAEMAAWVESPTPELARHLVNLASPLIITTRAGSSEPRASIGVRDSALARAWVQECRQAKGLANQLDPNTCRGTILALPSLPVVELSVDGAQLRAVTRVAGTTPGPSSSGMTPIGRELSRYPIAIWGRGLNELSYANAQGAAPRMSLATTEIGVGVRVTSDGVDLMFAMRSVSANPEEVAATLEAAIAGEGDRAGVIREIASANPDTPIAEDVAAGSAGIGMAVASLQILSRYVFPSLREKALDAFEDEPARFLEAVGAAARVYYMTNGGYPVGETKWTWSGSCCSQYNRICEGEPPNWDTDPIWRALDVPLESRHRFLYHYRGTKDRFEVKAEADLDCDGEKTTRMWVTGSVENGGPALKYGRQGERN